MAGPSLTVPVVDSRALQAPDQRSVASPDLYGESARQNAELGKGLSMAGTGLAAVSYQMKQRDDATRVFEAETSLKEKYLQFEADMRANRSGGLARDVTRDATRWWDDQVKEHAAALTNDDQRRLFIMRAAPSRQSSLHAVSAFEYEQTTKHAKDAQSASTNMNWRSAAANPSEENLGIARKSVDQEVAVFTGIHGWSKDQTDQYRVKRMTEGHTAVFDNLVGRDYTAAKNYFEKNKAEIDPAQYDAFDKKLKAGGMDTLAQNFADGAIGQGLTEDQAIKRARDTLTGPEEEAVVKHLKGRYAEVKSERLGGLNLMILEGKPLAAIQATPQYRQANEDERALIIKTYRQEELARENLAYTRAARGNAEEQRKQAQLTREGAELTLRLSDPEALMRYSRNDILGMLPQLGAANVHALLGKYDALKGSQAKYLEAKIDNDDFKSLADTAGFKASEPPSKLNERERQNLLTLRSAVENRIADAQAAAGNKPITREAKMQIMQQVLDNQVLVANPLWFDKPKPAVVLTKDEAAKAYVVVDGQEVKLSSIPAQDRARIIQVRRQRGLSLSEEAIAKHWLDAQKILKKADPAKAVPY